MASSGKEQKPGIIGWFEYRLPIISFIDHSLGTQYPAPRNLNYWWNFGSLAGLCLVVQIITGIFLAMHYTPHVDMAFNSVEHIMRDVNYGWLLRYIHAVGASMFFIVVYIHIFRGLYYGSYKSPREVLWWLGVVILLLMMATAFMGYVLPWGQMSFWGATVITNLFSAIPIVGDPIVALLWGGFSVDNPTLNRFFSLHYLLPFVLVGIVVLHIWALHQHGSNNPTGIDVKTPKDTVPFHPYYTAKDAWTMGVFLIIFASFVFFAPNYLGHPDNYMPANPMVTPTHIVPEWYFLPYYAILRAITFNIPLYLPGLALLIGGLVAWRKPLLSFEASMAVIIVGGLITVLGIVGWFADPADPKAIRFVIDSKLAGVLAMFGSILVLFALPWLDGSKVRSASFRPVYRVLFWVFLVDAVVLGYAGSQPADWGMLLDLPDALNKHNLPDISVSLIGTAYYFAHFLVIMPLLGRFEKTLPLPESISKPVLGMA